MSSSLSQLPLYEIVLDELLLELSFQVTNDKISHSSKYPNIYDDDLFSRCILNYPLDNYR